MGFTISNYSLMGIPLQNIYVSIKGRYSIINNNFIYGIPNKYQIYADYWFSVGKGQPTVQCNSVVINTEELPQDIYAFIYENIKKNIDINYGTSEQALIFTDN